MVKVYRKSGKWGGRKVYGRKLLKLKMPIKEIIEITELTKEEIEKL